MNLQYDEHRPPFQNLIECELYLALNIGNRIGITNQISASNTHKSWGGEL
jgi:hypothetical protein